MWMSSRRRSRKDVAVCMHGRVSLVIVVSTSWFLSQWSHACSALLLRLLMEACHLGAPGTESQRFLCSLHLQLSSLLARSAFFALSFWRFVLSAFSCPAVMSFASSRLSFQCWLRSRTPSQWASPESWAPPVQVVASLLLSQARLWLLQLRQCPQHLQQCPRPVMRWRPLCCAPRLSGPPLPGRALVLALLRRCPNRSGHRVAAPALPLVCVVLSPLRSRDWSRAWPPRVAHRSRLPSCASHALLALSTQPRLSRSPPLTLLDRPLPPLRPPRPLVPRSLRPILMTNGTRSLTHTASLAPRPPSPSRLTPLELVGVLATSVAAVSAKPPSVPCGGTFSSLLLSLCVLPVQRGPAGGFALGSRMLSRVMSSCWSLQSFPAASGFAGFARRHRCWPWCGILLDFFGDSEKFYVCRSAPLVRTCEVGFFLVATFSGDAFTQVQDLLLLDITLLLMGVETAGGVMTKFFECNTTVLTVSNPDVHVTAVNQLGVLILRMCPLSLVDHSDVIGPFSARLHEAPCRWQLLFASFRSRLIGCVDPS